MVNIKFLSKNIELWSIVKKWGLTKLKTKKILADWGKVNYQEKVSVDWRLNPVTTGSHSKLECWRTLQEDYKILSQTNATNCKL